jgi:hypothetical protein
VKLLAWARSRRWLPSAVVAAAALLYPVIVLAGGAPSFPSREDCVHPATRDGAIALVFGYFDSSVQAALQQERVRRVGYREANVESDGGCGRVRVVVDGYTTLAGARDAVAEARSVGLRPTLELAG